MRLGEIALVREHREAAIIFSQIMAWHPKGLIPGGRFDIRTAKQARARRAGLKRAEFWRKWDFPNLVKARAVLAEKRRLAKTLRELELR
jgi:hypothetical protein